MSEGPIAQWWKAHEPEKVSTPNAQRVCFIIPPSPRTYCGRKGEKSVTVSLAAVKCADCEAAMRADSQTLVRQDSEGKT